MTGTEAAHPSANQSPKTTAAVASAPCPCGLGTPYAECCGLFHSGAASAPTAERLMRSRYATFAVGDLAYLLHSWHPSTRPTELELDAELQWKRLLVEHMSGGGPFDAAGTVLFTAIARDANGRHVQREHSRFVREHGDWFYVDGDARDEGV